MRRLQRFLACYMLDLDLVARMIFSLLPVKSGLVLPMDRTNWKYGKTDINVLLLGCGFGPKFVIDLQVAFAAQLRKNISLRNMKKAD